MVVLFRKLNVFIARASLFDTLIFCSKIEFVVNLYLILFTSNYFLFFPQLISSFFLLFKIRKENAGYLTNENISTRMKIIRSKKKNNREKNISNRNVC